MHSEPFLDDAAVPERMQTLARDPPRADVIAASVVLGRSVQGLVNIADPMARNLSAASFSSSVALGDPSSRAPASQLEVPHMFPLCPALV
jgi:hypothetical protein